MHRMRGKGYGTYGFDTRHGGVSRDADDLDGGACADLVMPLLGDQMVLLGVWYLGAWPGLAWDGWPSVVLCEYRCVGVMRGGHGRLQVQDSLLWMVNSVGIE